ncbi:MAG: helix-turn-helix domain-containing protein [Adlercreutzia sp.]
MFSVTVAEASTKLGVSPARVRQLIKSGILAAEQVAGIWLIDEKSVEARREHNPGRGRPSARLSQPNASHYLLMNRDHEVLAFRFDASTGEFLDADEIIDAKRAPLSIMSPRGTKASRVALSYWWSHRTIPKARHGIEAKLAELGIADTYDLPFKSMGLSLSDQYWIKPYGSKIRWSDINYFENDFAEAPVEEWMADVGLDSPDNTSDGVLSKRWVCRNGERCLLKGGTLLDQEPYNEVIATELFSRLLSEDDYVPYTLIEWGGAPVSSCPNFVGPTEEFIPASMNEVLPRPPSRQLSPHVECCRARRGGHRDGTRKMISATTSWPAPTATGVAALSAMWKPLSINRPLFDTGSSLWCRVPTRELAYTPFVVDMRPFYEDADRQLRLVGDTSWLNLDKLAGFPEWASDFLDENPSMYGRTDFIYEGLQKRIDYLGLLFG